MRFARIAYGVAAANGFLTLTPLYFMVGKIGHDAPPSVTHPEFHYGFVGVALLWQMVFVLIARDPIRTDPLCRSRFWKSSSIRFPLFSCTSKDRSTHESFRLR
jgi:hypothetical protein